jgi:hypothetical protein
VNRRSFLLGVCAACSGPTRNEPRRKPKRVDPMPSPAVQDNTLAMSQVRASPLAFRGDLLVQSTGDELRAWNAITMQRTDTWRVPHQHFCFVQDGTLVAFGFAKGAGTTIHRIANGKVSAVDGPIVPSGGTNVVLPARSPDELYVSAGEHIYLVRGADVEAILAHPAPHQWNRDQLIGRGDGRIVGRDHENGFHVLDPKTSTRFPTPGRIVVHLVAATRDRVWYSYETRAGGEGNARTLVLAPVDKPTTDEHAIDFTPARIVHLASYGDTVAALVLALRDKAEWSVVVADETGRERRRIAVPQGDPALVHGFVAIGANRVVLASHDGNLLAWDTATGSPVT